MILFRPTRPLLWVALTLVLSACSDEAPPAPEPGTITVTLVSPAGAEGAALFEVAGPVSGVSMQGGEAFAEAEGAVTRVAMVRDPAGALSVELGVEDIHRLPGLTLIQVAGPDDQLRASLAGYSLEVER